MHAPHPRARPSPPSLPQRPPAVHLRQSVPAGREGRLRGPAGLRPLLDGTPHHQPGPGTACRSVLSAQGVLSPAAQVGGISTAGDHPHPPRSSGCHPPWGSRPSHPCPPPTRPNKELFNCSELRLPSSPSPTPSLAPAGPPHGVLGRQDQLAGEGPRWARPVLPYLTVPSPGLAAGAPAQAHPAEGSGPSGSRPACLGRAGAAPWWFREASLPAGQRGRAWSHGHAPWPVEIVFLAFKNV